jgi:hypothetical protein
MNIFYTLSCQISQNYEEREKDTTPSEQFLIPIGNIVETEALCPLTLITCRIGMRTVPLNGLYYFFADHRCP